MRAAPGIVDNIVTTGIRVVAIARAPATDE